MKDIKKGFEMIVESLKIPTHKTIKELIRRLEALEKTVAKSITEPKTGATPNKKKAPKARSAKKPTPSQTGATKKPKKAAPKTVSGEQFATEKVLTAIKKSSKGVTVGTLRKATGLESKQVSNIVFRLLKQKKIVKKDRGVYAVK